MQVTVKYVNPPREGKTNGSIRLADGSYISVPPALLPLFEGTENTTVDIATRSFPGSSGTTIIMAESGPGGTRAPGPRPVQRPGQPQVIQGGPVGGSGPMPAYGTTAPRNTDTDKHIFVTGIVGRAMGSGKFTASEIRVLTQAALEAFEMLSKPLPPAKPVPIQTGTDNKWSSPPDDESGDPGPQLQ